MFVGDVWFPSDFVILDMKEDVEAPLIFRRNFLITARATINVEFGKITRSKNKHNVRRNFRKNTQCSKLKCLTISRNKVKRKIKVQERLLTIIIFFDQMQVFRAHDIK